MKLLQVNNVSGLCGGTAGCSISIVHALPDFDHHVYFFSGGVTDEHKEIYRGAALHTGRTTPLTPMLIEQISPDVIIFHNTAETGFPNFIPGEPVTIYYQHSAIGSSRGPRLKCDIALGVSKYLCDQAYLDSEWFMYQPIHMPDGERQEHKDRPLTIGRLCTPNAMKWDHAKVLELYKYLGALHRDVAWEFVGCPGPIKDELAEACNGQVVYHDPSHEARSLLYHWDAMLYASETKESYGRTVCEAQIAGCIPVVPNHSGFAEQVNHGANGFLCDEMGDYGWAVKMLKDSDRLNELRSHAVPAGKTRGDLGLWRRTFLNWLRAILETNDERTPD